jgi:16S rRNA (guanine(966)-N(2))-methyltransferase RsmD
MRVIAGSRRGARLRTGRVDGFRPTSDRVREAIFDVLAGAVEGRRVLDLFAGSGALGFEALSRGASSVTFVERGRLAAGWIERNGRDLRFEGSFRVVRGDVLEFLAEPGEAAGSDLVFADPPYGAGLVAPTLAALAEIPGERLVVLEREKREKGPWAGLVWHPEGVYGDTVVEYLVIGRKEEQLR